MKNRIREFREQHGLTQKELGGSVGVSRQAIHAVETGKFDPSIWLAHDLAHYFGVTIEELLEWGQQVQPSVHSINQEVDYGGEDCESYYQRTDKICLS